MVSNNMHWAWKVSFIFSVVWLGFVIVESGTYFRGDDYIIMMTPITIWVIVRWIKIGKKTIKASDT